MRRDEQRSAEATTRDLLAALRLPLLCAPMSFVSCLPLTLACCEAGVLGGWQGGNVPPIEEFALYLETLEAAANRAADVGRAFAPLVFILRVAVARYPGLGAA